MWTLFKALKSMRNGSLVGLGGGPGLLANLSLAIAPLMQKRVEEQQTQRYSFFVVIVLLKTPFWIQKLMIGPK